MPVTEETRKRIVRVCYGNEMRNGAIEYEIVTAANAIEPITGRAAQLAFCS